MQMCEDLLELVLGRIDQSVAVVVGSEIEVEACGQVLAEFVVEEVYDAQGCRCRSRDNRGKHLAWRLQTPARSRPSSTTLSCPTTSGGIVNKESGEASLQYRGRVNFFSPYKQPRQLCFHLKLIVWNFFTDQHQFYEA
jgi:hypothetical protein